MHVQSLIAPAPAERFNVPAVDGLARPREGEFVPEIREFLLRDVGRRLAESRFRHGPTPCPVELWTANQPPNSAHHDLPNFSGGTSQVCRRGPQQCLPFNRHQRVDRTDNTDGSASRLG